MQKQTNLKNKFTRASITRWSEINPLFGDLFYTLDGVQIQRGAKLNGVARLPNVLNNNVTTVGDLIPTTSWGSSLANILTKKSWDGLRLPLIAANHGVCELCGCKPDTMEVHEVWSYTYPDISLSDKRQKEIVFGIQSLEGLMGLCGPCHLCFHLGYANTQKKLKPTLARLAAINGWVSNEINLYYKEIGDRWKSNSEFFWALDTSKFLPQDGGLIVDTKWATHPEDERFLTRENNGTDQITTLINTPWSFPKENSWRQPTSFQDKNLDTQSAGLLT